MDISTAGRFDCLADIKRVTALPIFFIVFTPFLGFIWTVFDKDQQFLHDRLVGTRLIDAPVKPKMKPVP